MSEQEPRTLRKLITLSERNLDMIEAIAKETGWDTSTLVIRRGIEELYKQTFKYGKDPLNNASENDTPEVIAKKAKNRAEIKQAQKEAEELAKLKPKIDMCINLLGGEIETNEKGFKYCRFTQYGTEESKDSSLSIPIKQVDPIIAETSLFMPSKEVVFAKRVDIKSKFS